MLSARSWGSFVTDAGRCMALDVGEVRIGVALSDPLGIIAQPHSVIAVKDPASDVEVVRTLVEETGTQTLVIGVPLNQEGQPGPQARKVLEFVERLRQAVAVEIVLQDERFSTAAAERELISAGVRRQKRKGVIDKIAAQRILQTFLDRRARQRRESHS